MNPLSVRSISGAARPSCLALGLAVALFAVHAFAAGPRQVIRIVGAPHALELIQPAVERFATSHQRPVPSIQVTGSGPGFAQLCAGVGFKFPDLNATTRRITSAEFEACRRNGVTDVSEIVIGRDALAVVSAGNAQLDLSRAQLFAALAGTISRGGKLAANDSRLWSDVGAGLPAKPIRVMGPPPDSSAMSDFLELVIAEGCGRFSQAAPATAGQQFQACRSLRRDGVFVDGPKNELMTLEWLRQHPDGLGVVRYATLQRARAQLTVHRIEGVAPSADSIASGRYTLSQALYVYTKNRHVATIPALQQLLYDLTSEREISPDGHLPSGGGLVALDELGRNRARDGALGLAPIKSAAP